MKNLKKNVISAFYALVLITLSSLAIEMTYQIPFWEMFSVLALLAFGLPFFVKSQANYMLTGLYREAWDRQLIKRFNTVDQGNWRNGIRDIGQYFNMLQDGEVVVVNLAYWGVSPDVLINNTSYPIDVQVLDAENLVVTVHKFQTKVTPITDDEIFGLNYDKMAAVQESHVVKVEETKIAMGIHSVSPNANTSNTPVLVTTGADDGFGRKKLLTADILTLRKKWNDLKIPMAGRRLVLCNDHISDLLSLDQKFQEQYYNYTTGKIANVFGFEIFEVTDMPYYHVTNKTKLAFGGVITGNHRQASTAFHLQRVVQGKGFTKNYLSPSALDPQQQRNLFAIRHYDIVVPYKQEGIAAIVSGTV